MTCKFEQLSDASEGLGYEAELFSSAEPRIGLWTAIERSLVCPRAYSVRDGFDAACSTSRKMGWRVHQRPTGGGTVPQGPGVDNLALAFNAPAGFTIEDGYQLITDVIKHGLRPNGEMLEAGNTPDSFCDGAWNLAVKGQKIVGTAQRWRPVRGGRPRVLVHALILTTDEFTEGTRAVSDFHHSLGLGPVKQSAHTSLFEAFGINELPVGKLYDAAERALADL